MTSTVLTPPPGEELARHQAHFPPVEVALGHGLGSGQQGDAVVPFSPSCMHSALTSSWSQRDAKRAECQIPSPRERKANPDHQAGTSPCSQLSQPSPYIRHTWVKQMKFIPEAKLFYRVFIPFSPLPLLCSYIHISVYLYLFFL